MEEGVLRGPPQPCTDAGVARARQAVLAGHLSRSQSARELLADEDEPVRSRALGALWRSGDLQILDLESAMHDEAPSVRRRACELAGRLHSSGDAGNELCPSLVAALHDSDDAVAETAAWALGEQGASAPRVVVDALTEMATSHREALCRESAIASLGAIGDERALPAVLAGLDDRPAIRRRSVVALAAFEGPLVDDALRKALADKDWQVRQAAEDLLRLDGD